MIFVDTNFFLRFILKDIDNQYQETKKLFEESALGKVSLSTSLIVFFEIYWVLSSFYKTKKGRTIRVLNNLLALGFIEFTEREIFGRALEIFSKENLSLEDCYNLSYAKACGAKEFKTFDKKLLKRF